MEKERLDILLVKKGLCASRERAKALIIAGAVTVDGQLANKPGEVYPAETDVALKGADCPYVGRGGLKLEKAIRTFCLSLEGKVCLDVGASTGGFTDCLLSFGAKKVYAIDVGYGQLAWKLRTDERVQVMERVNARYLTRDDFSEEINFASVDVSFISLKLIFSALKEVGVKEVAALIKPQFEAGKDKVGKKGIVREKSIHIEVLSTLLPELKKAGYGASKLTFSPITGQDGNIEFLGYFLLGGETAAFDLKEIVEKAHDSLKS